VFWQSVGHKPLRLAEDAGTTFAVGGALAGQDPAAAADAAFDSECSR